MIISHRHRFIFIKTAKTAGTSIEIGLSSMCGPEDIITPISPADESIRQQLGYPGPQNYRIPFSSYAKRDWYRFITKGERREFYNHADCHLIRHIVGKDIWKSYYKFAFERNPWDKVVSQYYWSNPKEPRPSLDEYIQSGGATRCMSFELYSERSEILVDKVFLYENLSEALSEIETRLSLPQKLILPNAKGSFRKDKRSYREIITPEGREKIARIAAREIAHFGYEW